MEFHTSFERLSETIASYEAAWGDVLHVETSSSAERATLDGTFEVRLGHLAIGEADDGQGLTPEDVEFREDAGVVFTFATTDLDAGSPSTPAGVTTSWEDVRIDADSGVVVTVSFEISPEESLSTVDAASNPTGATHTVADQNERSGVTTAVERGADAARAEEGTVAADVEEEGTVAADVEEEGTVAADVEEEEGAIQAEASKGGGVIAEDGESDAAAGVGGEPGGTAEDGGAGAVGSMDQGSGYVAAVGGASRQQDPADEGGPDALTEIRDEDVPPFRDQPYLEALYESCETFVEMSGVIDMDVSAETVRRYMIEAGVHQPDSYDSSGGAERGAEDLSEDHGSIDEDARGAVPDVDLDADRFGFAGELTIEETIDAVVDSRTLHEVSRHLDIEHDQARTLLRELDLLKFVSHRLVDAHEVEPTYEEVASRVRRSAPQSV